MTSPSTILWHCFGFPGSLGNVEMKMPNEISEEGTVYQLAGPEPALGRLEAGYKEKYKKAGWTATAMYRGLTSTQR